MIDMMMRYNSHRKPPISVITKWALASAALVRSVLTHNAERRIMRHGQIDGRQRLIGHAAGSA
jgi:hypothetical protein